MVKPDLANKMAGTSLDVQLPKRPAYGTAGRPTVLFTNYVKLEGIKPDTTFYRYSVAFQPDNEIKKAKKRRLIEQLMNMPPFAGIPIASDWAQVLIGPKKVPLAKKRDSFKIEWYPADGDPLPSQTPDEAPRIAQSRKKNTHTALIEELATVSVADLLKDLSQPGMTYPLKLETIQALNVVMAHGPSSDPNIATAGGNKFYPFGVHPQVQTMPLGGGLMAARGYFSSVRTSVNRILVNVNVATGAFYKSGPLLDVMLDYGPHPQNDFQQQRLSAFLRLLKFETNYIRETGKDGKPKLGPKGVPITKRKVHIIAALSRFGQNARTVTFQEVGPGGAVAVVSVEAYFKKKYNITLKHPLAPLVNYGTPPAPKWIPAELCTVLPGQLAKKLLLGSQTSEMIRFAARRPHENAESITGDGLQVTKINPIANGTYFPDYISVSGD